MLIWCQVLIPLIHLSKWMQWNALSGTMYDHILYCIPSESNCPALKCMKLWVFFGFFFRKSSRRYLFLSFFHREPPYTPHTIMIPILASRYKDTKKLNQIPHQWIPRVKSFSAKGKMCVFTSEKLNFETKFHFLLWSVLSIQKALDSIWIEIDFTIWRNYSFIYHWMHFSGVCMLCAGVDADADADDIKRKTNKNLISTQISWNTNIEANYDTEWFSWRKNKINLFILIW